jgi:alpha-beta hydrolase superfamily lysophospholipase
MPWFDGSRGRIHHDVWLPDGQVRSVVVFLHGFGEHLGLYEALARRLNADGHAVHALDCVGHGRSDGERGEMIWEAYVPDALALLRIATDRHPDVPVTLAGHSGGALAAFLVAVRNPGLPDRLVLSGPPLRPLDWVHQALSGAPDDEGLDPTTLLSTHPDYVHALMHDPLVYDGAMPRRMLESLSRQWPEVEQALASGRPEVPTLLVSGELDPVVPLAVPEEVAKRLPQSMLRVFAGDLHDVLNEHDRDDVHDVVAAFVNDVSAPGPIRSNA